MQTQTVRRKSNLRWGVEKRLEFIEFRLYWEGRMNRSDLMATFGVSVNQASTDLNRYLRLAPENMVYDKSARTYVRSQAFSPLFYRIESDSYLSQLRQVETGLLDPHDSWIRTFPEFGHVPSLVRVVSPERLQYVLDALRESRSIEVKYQSFSSPEPRWRWIAPHAIGFDGFRWHMRAFCEESDSFKDFLLARIIETRRERDSRSDPEQDHEWHEFVDLEIGPNPGLSESQRDVIALDYGMLGGRCSLRVRRAFVSYTVKRLGLKHDVDSTPPKTQHIVLLNPSEIKGLSLMDGD